MGEDVGGDGTSGSRGNTRHQSPSITTANNLFASSSRSGNATIESSVTPSGLVATPFDANIDYTATAFGRSATQEQVNEVASFFTNVCSGAQTAGDGVRGCLVCRTDLRPGVTETSSICLKPNSPHSGGTPGSSLNTRDSEFPTPMHRPQHHSDHGLILDGCIHPNHVAFLAGIGEMAREHAHQQRRHDYAARERDDGSTDSCSRSNIGRRAAQLSIGALISAEGQRVRMRLVSASSSRASTADPAAISEMERRGMEKTCGHRTTAFSLCTIISDFQPRKASYWQDDHLVKPYHGEKYGPVMQRPRLAKSDDNSASGERDEYVSASAATTDDEAAYNAACSSENGDYDGEKFESAAGAPNVVTDDDSTMRSYGRMLVHNGCRSDPVFRDAFFLDTGSITGGERRKKLIALHSYRASVISFVDEKVLKKDINNDFYVQHPELEVREIKLTHMRAIRMDLLNLALEETSPIELATMAYANWYFERLIMRGMVGKRNRRVALAVCVLLAIKFVETGDVHRKIQYLKARIRHDDVFKGVTWQKVQEWEFCAYVGLRFTLLPAPGSHVVETHLERLLAHVNLTSQEYYSKKFAWP